jgi:hypothetical protein
MSVVEYQIQIGGCYNNSNGRPAYCTVFTNSGAGLPVFNGMPAYQILTVSRQAGYRLTEGFCKILKGGLDCHLLNVCWFF